jgi:hypothetical protein
VYPVNEDEKLHKTNWEKIAKLLTNLQPKHCELDFEACLHTLQISKEDYINSHVTYLSINSIRALSSISLYIGVSFTKTNICMCGDSRI